MPRLVLGPMLRYVDDSSATVWVETSDPATVVVMGHSARTFTVHDHHYALVVIDGLHASEEYEYDVRLDGELVWPEAGSEFPPSVIRPRGADSDVRIIVGSCRAAAPHEPPYTLERAFDDDGRGIDTLWAHAERVKDAPSDHLPDLMLFIGDQIYADDSSPQCKERIEQLRGDDSDLPPEIVANFEEYSWLYHESWSLPSERWLMSTVSSAMIFDDHDMIDDWNISESWVEEQSRQPWWIDHARGGLMSYWIYQHLGNLSPAAIEREGLLERLCDAEDATEALRDWADGLESPDDEEQPEQRFSYVRRIGPVTMVMIDGRHGRKLHGESRLMVGSGEWAWVCEQARAADGHLLLATSMPVFIADGLHDLQVWSERICNGRWGRRAATWGERLRRSLDLEDWSAFAASYGAFVDLLEELGRRKSPPKSIVVASGDIHFSYAAKVPLDVGDGPDVWQIVSSPIRNALVPHERGVMRFSLTRAGRMIGGILRRLARAPRTRPGIEIAAGPLFANNLCELHYVDDQVELGIEHYEPDDDGRPDLVDLPRVRLA